MKKLVKTEEFWTVIIDFVVSVTLYFVGKYAVHGVFEDVKFIIAAIQPIAALLVAAFATEHVKEFAAGVVAQILGE